MLSESGVLDTSKKEKKIIVPFVDFGIQKLLVDNNFGPYLYAITGEQ